MQLAYLTNVYPAPSHSFIRREILAHEAAGRPVLRYSVRHFSGPLVDPADRGEAARTRYLLDAGILGLLLAMAGAAVRSPARFILALRMALRLARRGQRGMAIHLIYLAEACLLRSNLARQQATHLHVHFGTNPAAVALLCRLLGGPPYSFTVHGPDEFDSAPSLALDLKARHAAFVVAISDYGRSQLCRWVDPADFAKLQVVHCGLDQAFLAAEASASPQSGQIVFVGRLTVTKGVQVLLDAMRRLHQQGVQVELTMIGDGPARADMEQQIAREGLQSVIRLAGWRDSDEVRQEILRCRAMVLPSFAEGLPVVLMESLALGRPVISTWVAGIPELVQDGVCGYLVRPGCSDALADAIKRLLETPAAELTQMGLVGRERVLASHDAAKESAKLAALFRAAADGAVTEQGAWAAVPS